MSDTAPTWIMMVRDLSSTVRVQNEPQVIASLILDADTGLIRGVSMGKTAHEACAEAARSALTKPAGPLPPDPPVRVVYNDEDAYAGDVLSALRETLPDPEAPSRIPSPPLAEAEDIFDSLVGHLAGRRQPADLPRPADWAHLFAQASDYCRARPWRVRSDAYSDHLDLIVKVDGDAARYVAVVLGQEGIQHGLALYPGAVMPEGLADWRPGEPLPLPQGSLVLWLDPPEEVPAEFIAKAARYGWPDEAEFVPIPAIVTADGFVDVDRRSAHHLTLALLAVVTHDHRPLAGSARSSGTLPLADGQVGEYTIS